MTLTANLTAGDLLITSPRIPATSPASGVPRPPTVALVARSELGPGRDRDRETRPDRIRRGLSVGDVRASTRAP